MERILTVKQLKSFIDKVPGDAIVVLNSDDHSYRFARVTPCMALFYEDGTISEYDESIDDGVGKKKLVLVVE